MPDKPSLSGVYGEQCRVDLAEAGTCSSTCRRCGKPMTNGQAVYYIVYGSWLRNKLVDLHGGYLVHTACPILHPQDISAVPMDKPDGSATGERGGK